MQETWSLERTIGAHNTFVERVLAVTTTKATTTSVNHDAPDVAPAHVAFTIAGILILVVLILMGWGWMSRKLNIRSNARTSTSTSATHAALEHQVEIWTPHGNLSTTILVLACMIPSFLVLGGLQYNFNVTMLVITIFPIGLVIVGAMQTYSKFKSLRKQYWRTKRMGHASDTDTNDNDEDEDADDAHDLRYFESCIRKFEVHTLFADPDEPLARVVLVGTSQIMLLGMYVWGLWDRGPPDLSDPRLYAYYYAGMFMLVAYIAGKLSADKEAHLKWFAHQWRRSIQLGQHAAKREPVNRPSGLFSSPLFWAFYFLGVDLYEDDFSWASEGEITMATLVLRYVLDTLVNTAGLFYIMVGLPIQVAHYPGPVDFVLTALAAFYILEMDNSTDVHTVEIPNFDNERRSMETKDDSEAGDAGANELLTILNDLPSDTRKRLSELLKPSSSHVL